MARPRASLLDPWESIQMWQSFRRVALAALPTCLVVTSAGAAAPRDTVRAHPADVRFMQGMIAHHAQALEMAALIPSRSTTEQMRLLGERIDVSQRDEINAIRSWLRKRGEAVPDSTSPHAGHERMPGMLTAEEMARLAAAHGTEFDRLFLEFMIHHHEGALTMVATLFATPGATQESQIYSFASDVDADQRAEIRRMRTMLDALPADPTRRP
jgi:uncharacterized protein (DUF305 family)